MFFRCSRNRSRGSTARRSESCWKTSRSRSRTWCRSCSPIRTRTWCRGCSCPPCASGGRRRRRRRSTAQFSAYRWVFLLNVFFCVSCDFFFNAFGVCIFLYFAFLWIFQTAFPQHFATANVGSRWCILCVFCAQVLSRLCVFHVFGAFVCVFSPRVICDSFLNVSCSATTIAASSTNCFLLIPTLAILMFTVFAVFSIFAIFATFAIFAIIASSALFAIFFCIYLKAL